MTKSSKFCPCCYTDISKIKEQRKLNKENTIGFNVYKICPNCEIIINCDKSNPLIRCKDCLRLFGDTMTYKEHLPCYLKESVKCLMH